MKTLIALFIAAFPFAASACDNYSARDYPDVRMTELSKSYIVEWDRYKVEYAKTITKPFGFLMDGASELNDATAQEHYIVRDKLTGDVIFDSIVFVPNCQNDK